MDIDSADLIQFIYGMVKLLACVQTQGRRIFLSLMLTIASALQFTKKYKYFFILSFTVSVAVGHVHDTLQNENHSLRIHLQLAKLENQQLLELLHKKTQLVNFFNTRLQSIKNTNQRIQKRLQKENDQSIAELQSTKENNQRLLEELKSSQSTNEKLLAEKKELQKENDQNVAELQSTKENNQRLLNELKSSQSTNEKLQKQNDRINAKLKDTNQRLLDGEKESQKKIDQINANLLSSKDKNQQLLEEKIELIEKVQQIQSSHKWVESIERLEDYLHTIIHKMGESNNREIMIRNIDLMMKYTKQCRKFLDANKVEEMQTLKANSTEMDKEMDEIKEENNRFIPVHQNKGDKDKKIIYEHKTVYEHKTIYEHKSSETSLQESFTNKAISLGISAAYYVGSAVVSAVYRGISSFFW